MALLLRRTALWIPRTAFGLAHGFGRVGDLPSVKVVLYNLDNAIAGDTIASDSVTHFVLDDESGLRVTLLHGASRLERSDGVQAAGEEEDGGSWAARDGLGMGDGSRRLEGALEVISRPEGPLGAGEPSAAKDGANGRRLLDAGVGVVSPPVDRLVGDVAAVGAVDGPRGLGRPFELSFEPVRTRLDGSGFQVGGNALSDDGYVAVDGIVKGDGKGLEAVVWRVESIKDEGSDVVTTHNDSGPVLRDGCDWGFVQVSNGG